MAPKVSITTSDPLVSVAEAGQILGVTTVTVQRWARDGSIAAEKMPGKTGAYVLRRSEVERVKSERASKANA
ncbi:helix-turn-helix domain-containing protein [Mycolicibacterium mageritense]|uniref:helix-turn-helix domain-containing protein n=1 Tax=Mycolicibacterium mageritense TaxID=53462 RepID=UPI0034D39D77